MKQKRIWVTQDSDGDEMFLIQEKVWGLFWLTVDKAWSRDRAIHKYAKLNNKPKDYELKVEEIV